MTDRSRYFRRLSGVAVLGATAVMAVGVAAASADPDTLGKSTLEQRIVPNGDPDFRELGLGPGESPYIVREQGVGTAQAGRETRRTSLLYFGQLSDFQLADEESPARVEFVDTGPFSAAWRPSEALNPQIDDAMIRQIDAYADASPVADGSGGHRPMDLTITTGDNADSQQLNETQWVRTLLEGGELNPGSGINPVGYIHQTCLLSVLPIIKDAANPQAYTGVQDFDDYDEGPAPQYYDPDVPSGAYAAWPDHDGLMDRANLPFQATGLDVPSYVALGNHDGLVQGNAFANRSYEDVSTGCIKPISPVVTDPGSFEEAFGQLDPAKLLAELAGNPTTQRLAFVPPDPKRRYVSKKQYKDVFLAGSQSDGHGFAYVDPAENAASGGAAAYYAFSPVPGIRFIHLDTISEGGMIGPSADGNVDHPQFQWLEGQLQDATAADELVVLFSHHAIPSLTSDVADEEAGACGVDDGHGHGFNPGCDIDPRGSTPVHLGPDMKALLFQYPHVVAWVAGHSHVNAIEPHANPAGGGFWSIRVAAEADWPQQTRLIDLFDNDDGTLSIFGTIIDHASNSTAPPSGTPAAGLGTADLASIGRTLAANDPQAGIGTGEGDPDDRNVELLVADPREGGGGGSSCLNRVEGTPGKDTIEGTPGPDRLLGRRGADRLRGKKGDDCVRGGRGADRLRGGGGADKVIGGRGRDRMRGGGGVDRLKAGRGRDRVRAAEGEAETVDCGPGHDVAFVDGADTPVDCEVVGQ